MRGESYMSRSVTNRKRKRRKLIILIIEIIIIVILAAGLFLFNKLNLMQREDLGDISFNQLNKETEKTLTGYTDIALFGLDNRTMGQYENGNSDVIMVLSINNDTKEAKIVSVYRDTFLNVGEEGSPSFQKCNAAYAYGGPTRAVQMLDKNLDLDIDKYVTFDFQSVADAIDLLGGVEIEIESQEELKYLNKYISHTNGILDTNEPLVSGTGKQNLSGVQAVAYARIRYTAGGDYKRAQRQRIVLTEMIKKAKKANLGTLNKMINKILPEIHTNLSQTEVLTLVKAMMSYSADDSRGFPFDKRATTLGSKGSVVVPCDLVSNVTQLHEYLYGASDYEPSEEVESYSWTIVNQSGLTKDSAVTDEFSEADGADEESDEDSDS